MAPPNVDRSNAEIKVIWREQKLEQTLPPKTVVCSETAGECFSDVSEFNNALDQNTAAFDYQKFTATFTSTSPNQARIFSDGRGFYSNISDFKQALNSPRQTQVYDLKDLPNPVKGLLVLGGILGGALVGNGPGAVAGGALMLAACGYEQDPLKNEESSNDYVHKTAEYRENCPDSVAEYFARSRGCGVARDPDFSTTPNSAASVYVPQAPSIINRGEYWDSQLFLNDLLRSKSCIVDCSWTAAEKYGDPSEYFQCDVRITTNAQANAINVQNLTSRSQNGVDPTYNECATNNP